MKERETRDALGIHIMVEYYGCSERSLNDPDAIKREMVAAVEKIGATVVSSSAHAFSPHGVSAVVVISESHMTMHTWPEYRYAAVDLFYCTRAIDPWIAVDHLKTFLNADHFTSVEMKRGSLKNFEG